MTTSHHYCTFFLDGLCFGVEVPKVQEVIRFQEMTRVPLASPVVSGLINLRGQIVTGIDLRRRLGLADRPTGQLPMNVVVSTDHGIVSLLVDEIGDVQEVERDTFEKPPETLNGTARTLILGTYKLDERLLLVLDAEQAASLQAESSFDCPGPLAHQTALPTSLQQATRSAPFGEMQS
jgi:purine-binding chemotaxis protein CheW